ncbi:MAG: leucine-rich repeat protein [Bacteroidaceae bacterium]|nr:leucine-rich repeat protein [Bacteroidaceae bacterium]
MKQKLLLLLVALLPVVANAYDAKIDGIYYYFIEGISYNEASVTSRTTTNSYSGDVVIPESVNYKDKTYHVTSINSNAFNGCYSLTSVSIPNSLTQIGARAFYDCKGLTSVTIGNGVTSIGRFAFSYCTGLTSVTIGNGVKNIGQAAFYGCNGLITIVIPESVTIIDDYAFYGCGKLCFIKLGKESPVEIHNSTFSNRANAVLQVPKGCKTSYETAYYWKDFKKIVDYIDNGDVNIDEQVNVVDVVDIARFVVGNPADTFVEVLADINKDGSVSIGDAVTLVNDIAGDPELRESMECSWQLYSRRHAEPDGTWCLSIVEPRQRTQLHGLPVRPLCA